ncbi:hypothetical protein [Paenibacillus agricola]|nr:hypothetical protein [Paenibacillus agricola]
MSEENKEQNEELELKLEDLQEQVAEAELEQVSGGGVRPRTRPPR